MTRTARGIKKGQPLRFIHGHNVHAWRGPAHPQWIDGRAKSQEARSLYNRAHHKKTYAKRRDRVLAKNKAWRARNPENVRNRSLRKFGITAAAYDAMFAVQSGVCAICGQPETRTVRGKLTRLAVDHDHMAGHVRGLLCYFCNTAIGLLREDAQVMRSAMAYLSAPGAARGRP